MKIKLMTWCVWAMALGSMAYALEFGNGPGPLAFRAKMRGLGRSLGITSAAPMNDHLWPLVQFVGYQDELADIPANEHPSIVIPRCSQAAHGRKVYLDGGKRQWVCIQLDGSILSIPYAGIVVSEQHQDIAVVLSPEPSDDDAWWGLQIPVCSPDGARGHRAIWNDGAVLWLCIDASGQIGNALHPPDDIVRAQEIRRELEQEYVFTSSIAVIGWGPEAKCTASLSTRRALYPGSIGMFGYRTWKPRLNSDGQTVCYHDEARRAEDIPANSFQAPVFR